MPRLFVQMMLGVLVLASGAWAQQPQAMWYRGPFDGWVEVRSNPQPGYYYRPSPNTTYPLNESAYGAPLKCGTCGHWHYPGKDVCPYCHRSCPAGGNSLNPNTVYSPAPLPGQYWYKEQPHYRYASPMRLGWPYQKYTERYDVTQP